MTIYQFQWPFLGNIPVFIIDPNSKKLFSEDRPLPSHLLDLNIPENRYIKMSAAIKLFPNSLILEADVILRDLINNFKLEDKITLTTNLENKRQVITFLPITTFLAFLIIWPHCQAFKKVRNIVLTYLDNYSDSVCIDCGYVKQHCICEKLYVGVKKANLVGTGYGVRVIDKGCQTILLAKGLEVTNTKDNIQTNYLKYMSDTNNADMIQDSTSVPGEKQITIFKNINNILLPTHDDYIATVDMKNSRLNSYSIHNKANNIILPFANALKLQNSSYDISSSGIVILSQEDEAKNFKKNLINNNSQLNNKVIINENLNNNETSEIEKIPDELLPKDDAKKNSKLWKLIEDNDNSTSPYLLNNKLNLNHSENSMDIDDTEKQSINSSKGNNVLKDNNGNIDKLLVNKTVYKKFEYIPTGEHIFKCTILKCGQCFDTKDAAEMHCAVHASGDISQYTCPECDFKAPFFNWFNIVRHLRSAHERRICCDFYSCKFCGLSFENEDALINHLDFHYSNRYKCIYCGLLLLTWNQVQIHIDICAEKHRGNVSLGCPYCTFIFHKKNIRNIHLLSHCDDGVSCALCQDNKPWGDWKDLRKHYQSKHPKILSGRITPFRHDLPKKKKVPTATLR